MAINIYCDISKPRNHGRAPVLILGLYTEVGQSWVLPAGSGQQVGASALEVVQEAIKGVVVGVSEYHASASARGLAVVGTLQLLARL